MEQAKVAQLIVQQRKVLGMTQAELGYRIGVTDKAVSKWERGLSLPDVTSLRRLATELKIDLEEMLGGQFGDSAQSSNIHSSDGDASLAQLYSSALSLQLDQPSMGIVSPRLFGCNLEHTRSCIFKGLSAQMLRNRKFTGKPAACSGHADQWYPIGEQALLLFDKPYTRHHELYHMKRSHECNAQRIVNAHEGNVCGIGQHELSVQAGRPYKLRVIAKTAQPTTLTVCITSRHGVVEYARAELSLTGDEWGKYEAQLVSSTSDTDADFRMTFTQCTAVSIGAVSLLPDDAFCGMRRDVIALLKETGIRVLRWPGGNFAGEYNWFDGLLPVDMRAPFESCLGIETQPHTLGYDLHEINTDDFIALCREIGAEPYITINPCWNTPEENAAWVEYCNGDTTTPYGRLRAERGFPEPYNVRLWSLGNEFGYGHMEGDNSPEGYCKVAMENARCMLAVSPELQLCSSGPYPNLNWAQKSAAVMHKDVKLVSQHYYSHNPRYFDAEHFAKEYYAAVAGAEDLRRKLYQNRADLPDEVRISMDEWNVWYAWYRPSSVTDGVFCALTFHMLFSEAASCGIELACHFEAINEGILYVTPDHACLTAQGQVFTLMKHHVEGEICHQSPYAFATRRQGAITVTIVNASYDQCKPVSWKGCGEVLEAKLYTSDTVIPPSLFHEKKVDASGNAVTLPPHSILFLKLKA